MVGEANDAIDAELDSWLEEAEKTHVSVPKRLSESLKTEIHAIVADALQKELEKFKTAFEVQLTEILKSAAIDAALSVRRTLLKTTR